MNKTIETKFPSPSSQKLAKYLFWNSSLTSKIKTVFGTRLHFELDGLTFKFSLNVPVSTEAL
jgi:hypothetical protein